MSGCCTGMESMATSQAHDPPDQAGLRLIEVQELWHLAEWELEGSLVQHPSLFVWHNYVGLQEAARHVS